MIKSPFLRKFLGIHQVAKLYAAWREQVSRELVISNGLRELVVSIAIALLPLLSFYLPRKDGAPDPTTVSIGIATLLAVVYRVQKKVPFAYSHSWTRDLSLTHTAFALGCIPAVLVVLFFPESLFSLHTKQQSVHPGHVAAAGAWRSLFILEVAVWAGVTEEFIYRGLLISVLRRTRLFASQKQRDLFSVSVSSLIFGLGHLPVWGPAMSVALTGLGAGFGIAFIAIGEALLPLIIYHAVFDILSLSAAFLLYRT